MNKPILEYRTKDPTASQGSPLATLAMLVGIASGPAAIALCLFTVWIGGGGLLFLSFALPHAVALTLGVYSLVSSIRTHAPNGDRNQSLVGIVMACFWPLIIYGLIRASFQGL